MLKCYVKKCCYLEIFLFLLQSMFITVALWHVYNSSALVNSTGLEWWSFQKMEQVEGDMSFHWTHFLCVKSGCVKLSYLDYFVVKK